MKLFCCKFFIFKSVCQGLRDCPGILQQDPGTQDARYTMAGAESDSEDHLCSPGPTFLHDFSLQCIFSTFFSKKENVLGGANRIYQTPLYCRVS